VAQRSSSGIASAAGAPPKTSSSRPVATYARRWTLLLAAVPVVGFVAWTCWHTANVASAFTGHGNRLAFAWAVSFLLLWWVPVSWFERPYKVTERQERQLSDLTVVVLIPIYNEDSAALRACLESVIGQSRVPDRVRAVDDGSTEPYVEISEWFLSAARAAGIDATWQRTVNQGKRHAQMTAMAGDESDVIVTLDSDSVLDFRAIEEGVRPFADPEVTSVAGLVAVLNTKKNWLTFLTAMMYTPFTRGFRSAQSVLRCVLVNSGTLALYRGSVIRRYAGVYENETFWGRPMQMNDDSMLTFYGLLHGHAVHQPTCVAYTLVPDRMSPYFRQQLRWMRGTFVRTFWWFRYSRFSSPMFWMPLLELVQLLLSVVIPIALLMQPAARAHAGELAIATLMVGAAVNWTIALRFFMVRRSDEPFWFHFLLVAAAPLAGLWRLFVVKPLYFYALATFWRIGSWGTREKGAEVGLGS
jgi:hyaluronan synthase